MKHVYIRTHITATPFDNPHIKRIIAEEVRHQSRVRRSEVRIVDPFARESWLTTKPQGVKGITNDINEAMPTDFHLEAKDFAQLTRDRDWETRL